MVAFQVGKVELDRCNFCKGLWFDGGELSAVLGKPVTPKLDAGSTSRSCATCRLAMTPAVLGGLRVEVCTKCKGIFLDEGELVTLNGGQKIRTQQQAPVAPAAEAKVKSDVASWLADLGV
jgi:Zn-finger nucleic acid-binding protein